MTALVSARPFTAVRALTYSRPSLNGWPGIPSETDSRLRTATVPGTHKSMLLRREVMPLFLNLMARINRELMPLNPGPLDSWEYRDARQGGGLSNHASGTAIDFRYDKLLADHLTHLTPTQRAKMERILDSYKTADGHRLFGWGGEWRNGVSRDEMHLEVGQSWQVGRAITPADFAEATRRMHVRPDGTVGATTPTRPVSPAPHPTSKTVHLHLLRPGLQNAEILSLQKALKAHGFDPGPLDGQFGPRTRAAVTALQRSLGFTGHDADGVPGRTSLSRLGFSVIA